MSFIRRARAAVRAFTARYDAASTGRRSRVWGAVNGGPNIPAANLPTLRNRARDAVRNDALADSAVDTAVTNIIGTGIKPQFATPDAGLNAELATMWLDWTDEADPAGQLDFYGLQALAVRSMIEGGDSFGRFRLRRAEDSLTVPLQIQVLEGEFCPAEKSEMNGGNSIVSGVEFTPFGQRAAYWMYREHPYDGTNPRIQAGLPARVPASEVFHLMAVRRPGQVRGEPWLTRALVKLNELAQYDDAELMRKKIAAMFVGFRRRPVPEGMSADELAEAWGTADAEVDDGVGHVSMEPGTMQELDPGEDVEFTNPVDVGGNYEAFLRAQKRLVASAAGALYEQVTGDYSQVNDRTFRAAVNEFRRRCQMWQHHNAVYQMCRPTHRRWMAAGVLSGVIRPPRRMAERDLLRVKWVPQGWSYIHPVQDVQSQQMAVRSGFKSRAEVVSEQGYDAEQIDAEQAADNARADAAGLSYDSDGRRALTDPTKTTEQTENA
ncbi:phage portal protein [Roseospira visakhapatnamensis]|uniref:Lambda family phage portal protein n=1 Tax=Roseospira visakhapatnamensis TaxID=390880 RepID=A0A7W6WBD4_9PROT|nr:phage portal protein [Roseospira visakhapatnamensis]MBB4267723.1 lambda family phage portal protein [Roseospira visakhapatnamensis]